MTCARTVARRLGRFLGIADLARSADAAHERIDHHRAELSGARDQLRSRIQRLEQEQLALQWARAVYVTSTYLGSTPIPEDETISVVLATRNRAGLVRRAIDSVRAQSYTNWELIVVVDGSDDNTVDVVRQDDDPRVIIVEQEHRGLAAARNTGLATASGAYVVYLDDDNAMYEHWMRGVVWAFTVHPVADVMIGVFLVDDVVRWQNPGRGGWPHLVVTDELDRAAITYKSQTDIMQIAHRRAVSARFDEEDTLFEDWTFLARLTQRKGPVRFPAFAGIYTTTTAGRLMDADADVQERETQRIRAKLEHDH